MKGLLYKDLLYLRQLGKTLLLLLVFYVVLFTMTGGENNGLFAAVIVMLSVILVINTFSYDENAKWDSYAVSLPLNRDSIVLAKYVLVLAVSGSISVLLLLSVTVAEHGFPTDSMAQIGAGLGMALIFCGILMPLFYRFGMQKARLMIIACFLIPNIVALLWNEMKLPVPSVSEAAVGKLLLVSPVLVLLLYALSYFISCVVYRKKEI
jgi:ABC-2 type transport system permease protein